MQMSSRKIPGREGAPDIALALRQLRERLDVNQRDFAQLIGVTQGAVGHWETGKKNPSPMALMAIGKLGGADKAFWYGLAGPRYALIEEAVDTYKSRHTVEKDDNRTIEIHANAGPGPNRFRSKDAIARVSLLNAWFREGQAPIGLIASGESMAPQIQSGDLVVVDVYDFADHASLENSMVAVRNGDRTEVRWLQRRGESAYLVSQNVGPGLAPLEVVKGKHQVIGRVVKWISGPSGSTTGK